MIRGIYTSTSAMESNQYKLNFAANNLANVNTTGYKKDGFLQKSFKEVLISRIDGQGRSVPLGSIGSGNKLTESFTDYTQGNIRDTGNKLDVAIDGEGFFVVQTPNGERYTRDGNFTLNSDGLIVTQEGYPVLGDRGPLQTVEGQSIIIDQEGQLYLGDVEGDQFRIVNFPELRLLEKEGDSLFSSGNQLPEDTENYQLRQGFLEGSNVNIIEEMVNMIQLNRNYDATQKMITTMDNMLDKTVNSVGRLA